VNGGKQLLALELCGGESFEACGNISGQTCLSSEMSPKKLEFLKAAAPRSSRVAFLYNPDDPGPSLGLKLCQEAAPSLGMETSDQKCSRQRLGRRQRRRGGNSNGDDVRRDRGWEKSGFHQDRPRIGSVNQVHRPTLNLSGGGKASVSQQIGEALEQMGELSGPDLQTSLGHARSQPAAPQRTR
jgi:hypothetical protein